MTRELRTVTRSPLSSVVLLAVLLVLGAGFCLADGHAGGDHASHAVSFDLCLGMIGVTLVSVPVIVLLMSRFASLAPIVAALPAPVFVLEPPPRS